MMNYNKLTPQEERVIINKATEPPFKGEYDNFYQDGTFICRRCNAPLFSSKSKFDAGCGWPSFELKFYTSHVLAKIHVTGVTPSIITGSISVIILSDSSYVA